MASSLYDSVYYSKEEKGKERKRHSDTHYSLDRSLSLLQFYSIYYYYYYYYY